MWRRVGLVRWRRAGQLEQGGEAVLHRPAGSVLAAPACHPGQGSLDAVLEPRGACRALRSGCWRPAARPARHPLGVSKRKVTVSPPSSALMVITSSLPAHLRPGGGWGGWVGRGVGGRAASQRQLLRPCRGGCELSWQSPQVGLEHHRVTQQAGRAGQPQEQQGKQGGRTRADAGLGRHKHPARQRMQGGVQRGFALAAAAWHGSERAGRT